MIKGINVPMAEINSVVLITTEFEIFIIMPLLSLLFLRIVCRAAIVMAAQDIAMKTKNKEFIGTFFAVL